MLTSQQVHSRLGEGLAHHNAGRFDRAEVIYRQLAAVAPRTPAIFEAWGQLAEQQGRIDDALRCYMHAWRMDERSIGTATRLARALVSAGRAPEGEKVLRRVIELQPDSAAGWNHLGHALKVQGRLPEALQCHERAVQVDPRYMPGWADYGLTLGAFCQNRDSLEKYDRALAIDPSFWPARYGKAQALHKLYRTEEAIADYDLVLRADPQNHEARSFRLFALQTAPGVTRERLFAEHCAYGKAVGTGPARLPGYDLSPERKLRLAILSPDLRTHSCAYFLEPLIRHLDRSQFELYLYHDHFHTDEMSARLRRYAAVWRNFVAQGPAVVERVIRADRPDVLVDLSAHIGTMVRLPLFAKRLAPVQITYLGYPDTTGVPAMDFRFTDAIADPPGEADAFATEQLVRFSSVAWAYQPPADAPAVEPLGRPADAPIVFGCFNSPTKFTDALYAVWARLLVRVPNSRLLLKGRDLEPGEVRDYLLGRMEANGIPRDRLDLVPRTLSTAEHLRMYGRIDIALDTFPYNGTTTTCEALWMGRPVVTILGDRHAARVGASLLRAINHPEWIAADAEEYIARAVSLASDRVALATTCAGLREEMRRSALLDHVGQSARFAAAVRLCWQQKAEAARGGAAETSIISGQSVGGKA